MKRKIKKYWSVFASAMRFYKKNVINSLKFLYLFHRCRKHTHASAVDLLHLQHFVDIVTQEGIDGDIVECGSWRGGSSAMMLYRAREIGNPCHIYIYDSFEGLPEPLEIAYDGEKAQLVKTGELAWLKANQQDVIDIMQELGIYNTKVHIVKGWFESTIPSSPVEKITILHSDGDLYESTKTVLENFYHKVQKNGFIVNNDYGDVWLGAKKAMDEFVEKHCPGVKIIKIPGGGAYFRKP